MTAGCWESRPPLVSAFQTHKLGRAVLSIGFLPSCGGQSRDSMSLHALFLRDSFYQYVHCRAALWYPELNCFRFACLSRVGPHILAKLAHPKLLTGRFNEVITQAAILVQQVTLAPTNLHRLRSTALKDHLIARGDEGTIALCSRISGCHGVRPGHLSDRLALGVEPVTDPRAGVRSLERGNGLGNRRLCPDGKYPEWKKGPTHQVISETTACSPNSILLYRIDAMGKALHHKRKCVRYHCYNNHNVTSNRFLYTLSLLCAASLAHAERWPQFRGPEGLRVSTCMSLPA